MENQSSKQQQNIGNTEGSGTTYHKEHAGNVPDYGGNSVDPNARQGSNKTDTTK